MSEKGKKITLKVVDQEDLRRDVLKVSGNLFPSPVRIDDYNLSRVKPAG